MSTPAAGEPQILDAVALGVVLRNSPEFALFDLRDAKAFGTGAPLYGNNVAPENVGDEALRLVPHKQTPIALVDSNGSRLTAAAATLSALGYSAVYGLEGGLDGNERLPVLPIRIAGARVISGEVERAFRTPVTTPTELKALRDRGVPVVVFDSRSVEEYERGHIPGSVPSPGAEILARFHQTITSPETRVVVTCAGRSRAVLGAQTLIDAGVANAVSQLDFGTLGWKDQGLALAEGPEVPLAALAPESIAWASASLKRSRIDLPRIDRATLTAWLADSDRTTYPLDVRLPEAYAATHLPGSVSAPGGQLGIGIGKWVAVQGARLVLIDDEPGFRALTTGQWFKRLGWDVSIVTNDFGAH